MMRRIRVIISILAVSLVIIGLGLMISCSPIEPSPVDTAKTEPDTPESIKTEPETTMPASSDDLQTEPITTEPDETSEENHNPPDDPFLVYMDVNDIKIGDFYDDTFWRTHPFYSYSWKRGDSVYVNDRETGHLFRLKLLLEPPTPIYYVAEIIDTGIPVDYIAPEESLELIHVGMTFEEVVEILGRPFVRDVNFSYNRRSVEWRIIDYNHFVMIDFDIFYEESIEKALVAEIYDIMIGQPEPFDVEDVLRQLGRTREQG